MNVTLKYNKGYFGLFLITLTFLDLKRLKDKQSSTLALNSCHKSKPEPQT